jgi:hypothetical protein
LTSPINRPTRAPHGELFDNCLHHFPWHFSFLARFSFLTSLEFDKPRPLNPNNVCSHHNDQCEDDICQDDADHSDEGFDVEELIGNVVPDVLLQ